MSRRVFPGLTIEGKIDLFNLEFGLDSIVKQFADIFSVEEFDMLGVHWKIVTIDEDKIHRLNQTGGLGL